MTGAIAPHHPIWCLAGYVLYGRGYRLVPGEPSAYFVQKCDIANFCAIMYKFANTIRKVRVIFREKQTNVIYYNSTYSSQCSLSLRNITYSITVNYPRACPPERAQNIIHSASEM